MSKELTLNVFGIIVYGLWIYILVTQPLAFKLLASLVVINDFKFTFTRRW